MKTQTKNRLKAVYLAWVLMHLIILFIATPSKNSSRHIFPLYEGKYEDHYLNGVVINRYQIEPFQIDKVYDITEFLFYTIAPILIYYAISFWNKPKE